MPYYFPDDLKECYHLIGKFKSLSNGKITYQEYFAHDEEGMKAYELASFAQDIINFYKESKQ